ncbi:MAG: YceI family protein [Candidatus Sericytochromatia bacterium]|nr:YceI family protein [Candidatus Sericytochromatia bacterium]
MKAKTLWASAVALLMLSGTSAWASMAPKQVIGSGQHCVAWRTQKTMAMVKRQEAIGTSCSVTVKASKTGDGKYQASVTIPISSFNSKEKDRDKEVLKILQADKQANIEFTTLPLTAAQWQTMLKNGQGAVRGSLKIAGKSYPINTVAKLRKSGSNIEVYGFVQTKFTALGIPAPQVGPGGSIAKVDDYLELHFNLVSSKVQNYAIVK